jgi:hypothetical protein
VLLLISASGVARIIGMNHQYLAQKAFVKFFSNTPDDKNR